MHRFAAITVMDVLHRDVTNLHAKIISSSSQLMKNKNSSACNVEEMEAVYYSDQIYIFFLFKIER